MNLQRTKLKIVQESSSQSIDAIIESVQTIRARMESAADPGYGFGKKSGGGAEKPAGPKFTKKAKPAKA